MAALEALGFTAHKQPLSGALPEWPGDVCAEINGAKYIVEVKARRGEQKTLERWRGEADLLIYKADHKELMVWMPLEVLGSMLRK